jgi:hypothetical protein
VAVPKLSSSGYFGISAQNVEKSSKPYVSNTVFFLCFRGDTEEKPAEKHPSLSMELIEDKQDFSLIPAKIGSAMTLPKKHS